jgi:Lon protease-like protein
MGDEDFPRDRLLAALKTYLSSRDMKADWKSVMTAPGETLVNALAMMCPFDPAEKQALLEAQSFQDRASTLMALLEMGGEAGSTTLN